MEVICGRDAAERALAWQYPAGDSIDAQLREYGLLVAGRQGTFEPPPHLAPHIRALAVPELDSVSSSEVRMRCGQGVEWTHLVPETIHEMVREIYSGRGRAR